MRAQSKTSKIGQLVEEYFRSNCVPCFLGSITTGEVLRSVRSFFSANGMRLNAYNVGEVYDFIRDMGPEGENDTRWLRIYGKDSVSWCGNEPINVGDGRVA